MRILRMHFFGLWGIAVAGTLGHRGRRAHVLQLGVGVGRHVLQLLQCQHGMRRDARTGCACTCPVVFASGTAAGGEVPSMSAVWCAQVDFATCNGARYGLQHTGSGLVQWSGCLGSPGWVVMVQAGILALPPLPLPFVHFGHAATSSALLFESLSNRLCSSPVVAGWLFALRYCSV